MKKFIIANRDRSRLGAPALITRGFFALIWTMAADFFWARDLPGSFYTEMGIDRGSFSAIIIGNNSLPIIVIA